MKTKKFYDIRHADMLLNKSIVQFNGEPIFVQNVEPGAGNSYKITYSKLRGDDDDLYITFFPHREFDLTPVPLGLLNYKKRQLYNTSRVPLRAWKIGLTQKNLIFRPVLIPFDVRNNYGNAPYSLLTSKYLNNTIMGNFPSYKKAYTIVNSLSDREQAGRAFSRNFGIHRSIKGDYSLVYKGLVTRVGTIRPNSPTLLPNFSYLQELLEKDLDL